MLLYYLNSSYNYLWYICVLDLWSTKLTYLAIVGAAVSVLCVITLVSSVLIHSLDK